MDNSGTYSLRPIVLVVDQYSEMEKMIRSGLLACSSSVAFCTGVRDEVLSQIAADRPGVIIAPLQMENVNAVQLMQEVIQKTGASIPGIFIQDPALLELERQLGALCQAEFFPRQFHMSELLKRVEVLVGAASPRREYRSEHFLSPVVQKKTTAA
jgi:DNA-binding response OmpR family regulator